MSDNTVTYAGRAFWSRAIVITAHVQLTPDLSLGATEHALDLCTELYFLKVDDPVKTYAMRWSDRATQILGNHLEKLAYA